MDDLMSPEERRRRHRAWLESFGFSAADWRRIRLLAEGASPNYVPAALDDLSVPWRVGATMAADRRWSAGELLGVIEAPAGRVAVLAWAMTEPERSRWARRRRDG